MKKETNIDNVIAYKIQFIRGRRVLLDYDLAMLYEVPTKYLNKMVRRNTKRFPADFMFRLTQKEYSNLRFQFGTSKSPGGRRYLPYAFTEQGVAMLSSVLNSDKAIRVNILIMRIFADINKVLQSNSQIAQKLFELEGKLDGLEKRQDDESKEIYKVLKQLITQET